MGYYADAHGSVHAKSREKADAILWHIDRIGEWDKHDITQDGLDIYIDTSDYYHDDAYEELMDALVAEDLADSAEIECAGGVSEFWGFFLDKSNERGWVVKAGRVVYE